VKHFNNACHSLESDSFGIYNLGADNHFDYDCSNVPFPSLLTGNGWEAHGVVADPRFRDARSNDFRLREGSPCIDRGTPLPGLILDYGGEAPDIGAYDEGRLVEGLPFRFVDPGVEIPFRENPRITRHRFEEGRLRLWFSVPLSSSSLQDAHFHLHLDEQSWKADTAQPDREGYALTLEIGGIPIFTEEQQSRLKLSCESPPRGTNGLPVTSWASTLPLNFNP
jgi:hypothetical protein